MDNAIDGTVLLTPAEVNDRLKLGRSTVYRLLRTGELPSVRFGKAVRVQARALERWIEARQADTPDQHRAA